MKRHAIEPWTIGDYGKVYPADCLHEPILVDGFALAMSEREEAKANAKRIVECVNACAGIQDPAVALKWALEALQRAVTLAQAGQQFINDHPIGDYTVHYDEAECDGYCLADDFTALREQAQIAIDKLNAKRP